MRIPRKTSDEIRFDILGLGSSDGEFADGEFGNAGDRSGRAVIFEIKFDRLLEHPQGFFLGLPETGYIKIQTLRDVIRILAIEGVVDLSHVGKNRMGDGEGKLGGAEVEVTREEGGIDDWGLLSPRLTRSSVFLEWLARARKVLWQAWVRQ